MLAPVNPARAAFRRTRALLALCAIGSGLACGAPAPPHVLIVTLDTTRVDHLSVYGYPRETSPNLARFAERATRFTRAWSTSAWTLPAHASLFTGLPPESHGAQFDLRGEELEGGFSARGLDPGFETLAEWLGARGYATGAFVGGPWLNRRFGVLQGFEAIEDEAPQMGGRPAAELVAAAEAWLAEAPAERPVFLFVNFFDPHFPYWPPREFDRWSGARHEPSWAWVGRVLAGQPIPEPLREHLIALYDGEILAMDHELGRLLEIWERHVGDARSMVIVTSDHGESFGEQGFYLHNGSLGEEAVRVPLLIADPDGRGAGDVDERTIQLVDLPGYVAREVASEGWPEHWAADSDERERAFLALRRNHFRVERFGARYDRDLAALIEWPYKLVIPEPGTPTLWRIDEGSEREVEGEAVLRDRLLGAWHEHRRTLSPPPPLERVDVDPETLESLRALGYLAEPGGLTLPDAPGTLPRPPTTEGTRDGDHD